MRFLSIIYIGGEEVEVRSDDLTLDRLDKLVKFQSKFNLELVFYVPWL